MTRLPAQGGRLFTSIFEEIHSASLGRREKGVKATKNNTEMKEKDTAMLQTIRNESDRYSCGLIQQNYKNSHCISPIESTTPSLPEKAIAYKLARG